MQPVARLRTIGPSTLPRYPQRPSMRTPPVLVPLRVLTVFATAISFTTLYGQVPLVLYEFDGRGSVVHDTSESGEPVPLVQKEAAGTGVTREPGAIELRGKTRLLSSGAPREFTEAIQQSNAISIAIWLRPTNTKQAGPARIVTLSDGTSNRNFTIGQDGDKYQVRFRTTKTDANGLPGLTSPNGSVKTRLSHLVFTRAVDGTTSVFLDGRLASKGTSKGTLDDWDERYQLAIGDETSGGRGWSGTLYRVAMFDRALSPSEIRSAFNAGHEQTEVVVSPQQIAAQHFESSIAPLLSKHCLECHDIASAKGDLVLDRKASAFESAIVPGEPEESPLWVSVENDEMPHDRSPLLPEQKQLLKDWIAKGAVWSGEWIDPADYQHDDGTTTGYVRRLTVNEYIRSVKVAVGVEIDSQATRLLPADVRADGFSNTAYNLSVDLSHVQAYNDLARQIVQQIPIRSFAKRFGGKARLTDDMRALIEKMGRWILRGPLEKHEVDLYRGISTTIAAAGGDYDTAVAATIEAMLQSPRFLYRMESQDAEGETDWVDDYELASRLSFLVWGCPPDEPLMNASSDGSLAKSKTVSKQVQRMLSDKRAIDRSRDFISQWLNLGHVKTLQPDGSRFHGWNEKLASDMQTETLEFFDEVIWRQKRPLTDLLHAEVTFLTPELATHYGIKPDGEGWRRYDLSENPERGGLLTQGSVLTIGGDDASMVTRGLFVLNQLLRGVVNDPPPCVDTTPVPTSAGLSQRAIATERVENESCGGCHSRFEPLAFGLERYDGLGAYNKIDEHGNELREDGEILVPGTAKPFKYKNSRQLTKMLASSDRVSESLVWKLTQFAVGRPLTARDASVVRGIHQRSQVQGGTYQSVMKEIALSPFVWPRR